MKRPLLNERGAPKGVLKSRLRCCQGLCSPACVSGHPRKLRPTAASIVPLGITHHLRRRRRTHAGSHWRPRRWVHRRAHGRVHHRRAHGRSHGRSHRRCRLAACAWATAATSAAARSAPQGLDASEATDGLQATSEATAAIASATVAATSAALRQAQALQCAACATRLRWAGATATTATSRTPHGFQTAGQATGLDSLLHPGHWPDAMRGR
mmetsp:Transcript_14839/g.44010  ORF Transcript_14839/g.44010 Transcript_14839/m.44010 type:complete len:211 (+) Transcript_14839:154-786(+)